MTVGDRAKEIAASEFRAACLRQRDAARYQFEIESYENKLAAAERERDESLRVIALLGVSLGDACAAVKTGRYGSEHLNYGHFLLHFKALGGTD